MGRALRILPVLALLLAAAAPVSAGAAITRLEPREGRVALTFDDGPHPRWTPVILDLLDDYDVTATFFITGFRAEQHPELVAEIVRRGHSVQVHGHAHALMTGFSSSWVATDLQRNIDQIVAAGGSPTCWRPPYGEANQRVRDIAAGRGLATVLWDADSGDYAGASVDGAVRNVLRGLDDGDVILMHDLYGFIHDDSLPRIIAAVRARGLRFDTICDNRPPQRFDVTRLLRMPGGPI